MSDMSHLKEVNVGTREFAIPEDWRYVRLERISRRFISGGTPSTKNPSYWGGRIPWTTNAYVEGPYFSTPKDHITVAGLGNSASSIVPAGHLLFGTRVNVGNVAKSLIDIAISQDITGIVIDEGQAAPDYVMWYLMQMEPIFKQLQQGTTIKGLLTRDLRRFPILLPPLSEQKRIAEILSTVDEAIQKTEEVIEAATRLKRGLMQELLTRGIGHTEFKEERIGPRSLEIPATWTVRRLEGRNGLCRVVTGGTPQTTVDRYWNGDIHWVVPTDITNNDGIFISSSERMITEEGLSSSSATLMEPGAILLTTRATIGEACINTVPMATNQGFKSLVCGNDVDNLFLYYMIQREKKRLASLGGGSTFDEVSKSDVSGFEIPAPPIEEQKRISEILHSVDQFIYAESEYTSALQKLKKGLMQDLLTGKVRVKTDAG
jgi:type I restriction enzyme S subunit